MRCAGHIYAQRGKVMFRIGKTFAFEAAHFLPQMPDGHQCKRLHGHSYRVTVELAAIALDGSGFVRDYGELAWFDAWLKATLDHKFLNEVVGGGQNTTAERLAVILYRRIAMKEPLVVAVTVCETAKTFAKYEPMAGEGYDGTDELARIGRNLP